MSNEKKQKTQIGGQAVLEGVMMRGVSSMATAVRDEDGVICIESKRIIPTNKKNKFFSFPIIRGICAFIDSLIGGTKVLMRSAEVYGESEPTKFEKWVSDKLKVNIISVVIFFSLIIALALAIGLFMFLPQFLRTLIVGDANVWIKNLIEGGFKILIFVGYILLCTCIKDVKRTFMYHGAEHKTISCFEKGLPLTVENAKKCSRVHNRCGTTFLVFVMVISIITFSLFEALIIGTKVEGAIRILCKVLLLPLVAGLSYELLKALAKTESKVVYPLKVPGLLLQRLTTKEPSDDMLEVAIVAFNTVFEMDKDETIKEKEFIVSKKSKDLVCEVRQKLLKVGISEDAEAEWIVSILANIKRDEVYSDKYIKPVYIEKIQNVVEERCTGRPLWYCLGDTEFYGYKIKVDERVLIPRPETELIVLEAKKLIKENSKVLDLCTGSGALAIAISKECNIKVYASDISKDALSLAQENAILNNANVEFIESDLFDNIEEKSFDIIVCNPPYIKSDDIGVLQNEVKNYEPHIALDGGTDGLRYYKRIAMQCREFVHEGSTLFLECGIGQAQAIVDLFEFAKDKTVIKDLENIDRIVKVVF